MDSRELESLACYVNGTLSESERREIERQLDLRPEYRRQVDFYQALQREVRKAIAPCDPGLGLAKTLERIRGESQPQLPPSETIGSRVLAFLRASLSPRLAYTLGVVVIMLQATAITYLAQQRDEVYSDTRSGAVQPPAIGPFIKVTFRHDATEADLRFLLIEVGASIVGGPSQLGDYYLFLDPKRTDWAVQKLRNSQFVDSASVMATLPAAKE